MTQAEISILVIDDDPDQLELMSKYLRDSEIGCQPEGARSGGEALARLASRKYDLVILDYKMPGMNGLEVLLELRNRQLDVPVIMVTGMGDERIAVKALKQGANDYITKSGDYFATLPYIINNTLERYHLKQAQESLAKKLKESEKKYRTLFKDSPIALWEEDFSKINKHINQLIEAGVKDIKSYLDIHPEEVAAWAGMVKVLSANKAALDLFHARSKADFRQGLSTMLGVEPYSLFTQMLIALAEGKSGSEYETIDQTLTGERKTIVFKWTAAPRTDENGSTILVSVMDISQLKAMERERDNLVSMVAHDMKSGLVAIQWVAARLLKKTSTMAAPKQEEYIGVIKRAADRLEYLVSDILEVSTLRRGGPSLNFAPVSLDKELQELYESYKTRAQQQGIVLELRKDSPLPSIEADANRLNRVFINLLDNALKYSDKQGVVTIYAWQKARYVNIRISDEGPGISPSDLPYIFDLFHRGKETRKHSGLGVGLATVKAIVEGHGGWVSVESEPGKGSAFTVVLPIRRAEHL